MLKEKIQTDCVAAMRGKEELKLSTLRMLMAAIKNKEIEKHPLRQGSGQAELTDDEVLSIITSEVKKRTDATLDYTRGGRPELAAKEQAEKTLLETYLPAQLSAVELAALVDAAIKESGATTQKDFGLVMKALMPKVKGKAQGNKVSDLLKERLAGP